MDQGNGSTIGLDFSKGLVFANEIYKSFSVTVNPSDGTGLFIMVVSFIRHDFCLSDDSVVAASEAVIGESAIEFMVSNIRDKVFLFHVSCKQVGLHVLALCSFACEHFKCFFHLWGNGGPNWKREILIWRKECDAEWIFVSPTKRRSTIGLMAMHKPPAKSSLKYGSSCRKKLSFATFQNYPACKGYRYPATQSCIHTIENAGYDVSPRERVIIHPPSAPEVRWTVATPLICFGMVPPPSPLSLEITTNLDIHASSSEQLLGGMGSFSNPSLSDPPSTVGPIDPGSTSRAEPLETSPSLSPACK